MLRNHVRTSVCFGVVLSCSLALGEEWTQFRGSDYGRTSETQVNELWDASTVAWKTPLPGRGASCPVLFGNTIYLTAYTGYGTTHENPGSESDLEHHLFCIAATDGSVLWKKTVPTTSPKNYPVRPQIRETASPCAEECHSRGGSGDKIRCSTNTGRRPTGRSI